LDRNKKLVIACPHHGSKYSSSDEFLDFVSPDIAIISCGRHNMYGHPAPETLDRLEERGIRIYRTDLEGAVIINY
jgi:competence protein ComEC